MTRRRAERRMTSTRRARRRRRLRRLPRLHLLHRVLARQSSSRLQQLALLHLLLHLHSQPRRRAVALVERCSSTPRRQNRGQRRWHHRVRVAAVAVAAVAARAAPDLYTAQPIGTTRVAKRASTTISCARTRGRMRGAAAVEARRTLRAARSGSVPSDRARCPNDVLVAGRGRGRFLPLRALRSAGSVAAALVVVVVVVMRAANRPSILRPPRRQQRH